MGFCLRWFGILLGAVSLFSLAQRLYNFPTTTVAGYLLPYYRSNFHPFVSVFSEALGRWAQAIGLPAPSFSVEFIIIYFAAGFILLVLYIGDDLEWRRAGEESITLSSLFGRLAITCLWPVVLPMALYFIFDANRNTLKAWTSAIAKMLASSVFLLAANAGFSTLL